MVTASSATPRFAAPPESGERVRIGPSSVGACKDVAPQGRCLAEESRSLNTSQLRVVEASRSEGAVQLARSLSISHTAARVLVDRGYDDAQAAQRFMTPRLADLTAPEKMADRAIMADRLAYAVRRRERVCVFGDYDCDGITSTAILTLVLRRLGVDVVPLLASRFDGGYGVTPAAAKRIAASGASLVVTCDCGSSDHAVLADLGKGGQTVMVIDHHLVPEEPLPALAFINPHRPECEFPFKGLASCGLALSVVAAVRAQLGVQLDLREELDLVAIGTVADVAPLQGDNRALVRAGLQKLRFAKRPGVRAINELAKLGAELPFTASDIGFRIAPRLNAPGRLGAPDLALQTLLCSSPDQARGLAAELEQCQLERRNQQDVIVAQALRDIETNDWRERPAIVVGRPGWNHGIVGIVAGKLASDLGCPVAAVGFDDQGVGRGSVRGPRGANLFEALSQASDVLDRFGGHQAAAGFEVHLTRLGEFRERFEAVFAATPASSSPDEDDIVELDPRDDLTQVVSDFEALEPCGEGNPAPRLGARAHLVAAREVRGGHLKLELELGARRLGAFGLGMGHKAEALSGEVRLVGRLQRDRWRGGDAVEVGIERVETAV